MGLSDKLDDLKDKAGEMLGKGDNAERAKGAVDEAAEKADNATGGKATSQIDKAGNMAKEGIDKLKS
jgi:hypothetical protein